MSPTNEMLAQNHGHKFTDLSPACSREKHPWDTPDGLQYSRKTTLTAKEILACVERNLT